MVRKLAGLGTPNQGLPSLQPLWDWEQDTTVWLWGDRSVVLPPISEMAVSWRSFMPQDLVTSPRSRPGGCAQAQVGGCHPCCSEGPAWSSGCAWSLCHGHHAPLGTGQGKPPCRGHGAGWHSQTDGSWPRPGCEQPREARLSCWAFDKEATGAHKTATRFTSTFGTTTAAPCSPSPPQQGGDTALPPWSQELLCPQPGTEILGTSSPWHRLAGVTVAGTAWGRRGRAGRVPG